MSEERAVVDRHFGVERLHRSVWRHDERVDLAQHRVRLREAFVQLSDDVEHLLLLAWVVDAGAVDQPAALVRLKPFEHVCVQARERLRLRGCDLLDVDAALRREHEQRLLLGAVEGDREVVLLRDIRGDLDPQPADDVAANVETEDLARPGLRLCGPVGELDAAGLAAPAGQDLRLDYDLPAELDRGGARLLR
jgi:hypothetical protein